MDVFTDDFVEVLPGKEIVAIDVTIVSDFEAVFSRIIVFVEASSDSSRVIMLVPRVTSGGADIFPPIMERVQPEIPMDSRVTSVMNRIKTEYWNCSRASQI